MINPEDNFHVCNKCGQKVFSDWKAPFHIHPVECHVVQTTVIDLPMSAIAEIPIGIAAFV